jgi:rare lipoprotein A (peptidoglycan hydrolase)
LRRRVAVSIGKERLTTTAKRSGRFRLTWRPPRTGTFSVDVRARANRVATASRDSVGRVTVYRPAYASWYGPGLYGNPLACGGTLGPSTLGVAHKTLPCGTKLRLRYGSRTVAVRVIDRGPYVGGREFDLTAATKAALGFGSTGTVLSSR